MLGIGKEAGVGDNAEGGGGTGATVLVLGAAVEMLVTALGWVFEYGLECCCCACCPENEILGAEGNWKC